MLVALEGLEGVGKTTLGKIVAERLSAIYLKSPPDGMNSARAFVAKQSDAMCSFYFYLSSLYGMQRAVEEALNEGHGIIVDRYLGSTIAYHDQGRSFEPPAFDASGLRKADITVHVRCGAGERRTRLERRGFHIFERNRSDDGAIEAYFTRTCDFDFSNDEAIDVSAERLTRMLCERLGKHI